MRALPFCAAGAEKGEESVDEIFSPALGVGSISSSVGQRSIAVAFSMSRGHCPFENDSLDLHEASTGLCLVVAGSAAALPVADWTGVMR